MRRLDRWWPKHALRGPPTHAIQAENEPSRDSKSLFLLIINSNSTADDDDDQPTRKGHFFFFVLRPFNVVCVLVRNRKWNSRRAIEGIGGARTFIQMPFLRKVAARSTICLNFVYLISSLYYIRNCFCSIALTQTTRVTQLSHTNVYKWQLMHWTAVQSG